MSSVSLCGPGRPPRPRGVGIACGRGDARSGLGRYGWSHHSVTVVAVGFLALSRCFLLFLSFAAGAFSLVGPAAAAAANVWSPAL